jgi:hypothetical protein
MNLDDRMQEDELSGSSQRQVINVDLRTDGDDDVQFPG